MGRKVFHCTWKLNFESIVISNIEQKHFNTYILVKGIYNLLLINLNHRTNIRCNCSKKVSHRPGLVTGERLPPGSPWGAGKMILLKTTFCWPKPGGFSCISSYLTFSSAFLKPTKHFPFSKVERKIVRSVMLTMRLRIGIFSHATPSSMQPSSVVVCLK